MVPSHRNTWKASFNVGKYLGQSASYPGQCARQPAQPALPAGHGPAGKGWPGRQPGPLTPWLPNLDSQQANTKYSNITEGRLITPPLVKC